MACLYCYRWVEIGNLSAVQSWKTKPKARTGNCTLNPVWVETKGDHFCSHLAMKQGGATEGSTLMLAFRERLSDESDELSKERKERIRLEKVAKDLRAKLKANT
jgi:hypothetical protein